jgi:hypothetical protein
VSDDIRRGTADLAARLAQPTTGGLQGPPRRAPAPPPETDDSDKTPPEGKRDSDESADPDDRPEATRRRSRPRTGATREQTSPGPSATPARPAGERASAPAAINITVTLTNEAAVLLEQARQGSTVREILVGAVRATSEQLRVRHASVPDPSGAIPFVQIKSRRRLEGYGRKVAVRLYVIERDAIYALADELGITVSSLITEALELRYGDGSDPR